MFLTATSARELSVGCPSYQTIIAKARNCSDFAVIFVNYPLRNDTTPPDMTACITENHGEGSTGYRNGLVLAAHPSTS